MTDEADTSDLHGDLTTKANRDLAVLEFEGDPIKRNCRDRISPAHFWG
jgi:hypothetical protein